MSDQLRYPLIKRYELVLYLLLILSNSLFWTMVEKLAHWFSVLLDFSAYNIYSTQCTSINLYRYESIVHLGFFHFIQTDFHKNLLIKNTQSKFTIVIVKCGWKTCSIVDVVSLLSFTIILLIGLITYDNELDG